MTAPSAPRVTLSTSSVYPGTTASAFEVAGRLGYDGVEVMVGIDDVSADINAVRGLRDYHGVPVTSVHAPCLLITQRVWGTDPWAKLERSAEMAHALDADVVVVHPPFRWQRDYGRRFVEGVADLEQRTGIDFAVENMYPWRTGKRELQAYVPGWDPREQDYAHVTIDLSHTATSHSDPLAMAKDLGPRLRHVHVADGSGTGAKDEHLVPGRGSQPCADFLSQVVAAGFDGDLVVEISTRKAGSDANRETDLLESLAFVRLHADAGPA
ncbi:sugar phosphate isomerase/epimerase [Aeromicrobium sp. IC_218]|uniref:sugar phosphate isomerase/epimerase family protein n=1 Tax=Aeromicrobium sp. IC_218 TaxID=2545468 RepID=UPI00103E0925|nr:sugar phosphate isomerase/epimerase [Aeromicrobium sp. IC_218]TCJ00796.1 sugar phosphate isomerase/epimerase [Aeromicrobium sp. IC_218]